MSSPQLPDELVVLLRCPVSRQPLRLAQPAELARFPGVFPEGALITENEESLYPIRDGFPLVVSSERVVKDPADP